MLLSEMMKSSRSLNGGAPRFVHHHPLAAGSSNNTDEANADGPWKLGVLCHLLAAGFFATGLTLWQCRAKDEKVDLLWIVRMSHSTGLRDPTVILGRKAEFRSKLGKCEQAYIKD